MQAIMCTDEVSTLDSTLIPVSNYNVQVDGHPTTFRSFTTLSLVELGKKLLESSKEGDTEQVRTLMSRGAPFTTDWLGISPLHYAAQYGHVETAEVLLRAGISRDARTKVERTPLHIAAQEGNTAVVELLLSSGAEIDSRDMLRMTPLHWAVEREHIETVTVLLQRGADPNCVSKFNKTAFNIAIDNGRQDILHILETTGCTEVREEMSGENSLALHQTTLAATQSLTMELSQAPVSSNQEEIETHTESVSDIPRELIFFPEEPQETPVEKIFVTSTKPEQRTGNRKLPRELSPGQQTLQLLQAHGITMLPADDSTLVASAVENGQTIVLTEAGRLALALSQTPQKATVVTTMSTAPTTATTTATSSIGNTCKLGVAKKKVITIRAGPLLLPGNKTVNTLKRPTERIITSPSKVFLKAAPRGTFTITPPLRNKDSETTASTSDLAGQLEKLQRELETYKVLLNRKEREAEQYKLQLESMTQGK